MNKKHFFSRALLLAGVIVFSLTFAACGGSDDDDTPDVPEKTDTPTWDPTTETRPDATALSGLLKGTDGKYYLMTDLDGSTYSYNGQWIEYAGDYEWSPGKFTSPNTTVSYIFDGKGRIETLTVTVDNLSYDLTVVEATYKFTYNANGVSSYTVKQEQKNYQSGGKTVQSIWTMNHTHTFTWKDGDIIEHKKTGKNVSSVPETGWSNTFDVNEVDTYTYTDKENISGQFYYGIIPTMLPGVQQVRLSGTKHQLASIEHKDKVDSSNDYTRVYTISYNDTGLLSKCQYKDSNRSYTVSHTYGYIEYTKK